jgi:hypothetical protein
MARQQAVTKHGEHGTLYAYVVTFTDKGVSDFGEKQWTVWAYSIEHATGMFREEHVVSTQLMLEGAPRPDVVENPDRPLDPFGLPTAWKQPRVHHSGRRNPWDGPTIGPPGRCLECGTQDVPVAEPCPRCDVVFWGPPCPTCGVSGCICPAWEGFQPPKYPYG